MKRAWLEARRRERRAETGHARSGSTGAGRQPAVAPGRRSTACIAGEVVSTGQSDGAAGAGASAVLVGMGTIACIVEEVDSRVGDDRAGVPSLGTAGQDSGTLLA